MKKTISISMMMVLLACSCFNAVANQSVASINVQINEPLGVIDPTIYGHFTELTLSSFEGAIWSELLFNRKFEMPEERDINQIIFSGAAAAWEPIVTDSKVTLVPDTQVFYSPSRSQRITPKRRERCACRDSAKRISIRYATPGEKSTGGQSLSLRRGRALPGPLAIKKKDFQGAVHVALGDSYKAPAAKLSFDLKQGTEWNIYSGELRPSAAVEKGKFMIFIDSPGTVWVDSVSLTRVDLNEEGFRKDALELSRKVTPSMIRWPGGWFVSDYHWRDGVGPIDERPARFNRSWNAYVSNDVGTDEFILLCKKLGAEPYITVNVGTGTPEEAAQWVEYCNGGPNTEMGRLRAKNGHVQPYGVKYWNIGNEEYLPTLGGTDGRQYRSQLQSLRQGNAGS